MIKYVVYNTRDKTYYSNGRQFLPDINRAKLYMRIEDARYRRLVEGPWDKNRPNHNVVLAVKVTLEVVND